MTVPMPDPVASASVAQARRGGFFARLFGGLFGSANDSSDAKASAGSAATPRQGGDRSDGNRPKAEDARRGRDAGSSRRGSGTRDGRQQKDPRENRGTRDSRERPPEAISGERSRERTEGSDRGRRGGRRSRQGREQAAQNVDGVERANTENTGNQRTGGRSRRDRPRHDGSASEQALEMGVSAVALADVDTVERGLVTADFAHSEDPTEINVNAGAARNSELEHASDSPSTDTEISDKQQTSAVRDEPDNESFVVDTQGGAPARHAFNADAGVDDVKSDHDYGESGDVNGNVKDK